MSQDARIAPPSRMYPKLSGNGTQSNISFQSKSEKSKPLLAKALFADDSSTRKLSRAMCLSIIISFLQIKDKITTYIYQDYLK